MKYNLFIILATMLVIVEESINFSHPIRVTLPLSYFSDDQQQEFILIIFLVLGTGYALLALLLSRAVRSWSYTQCAFILAAGMIDKVFINPHSMILFLGVAILVAKWVMAGSYPEYLLGIVLLGAGIIVGLPLLILSLFNETFLNVALFQHLIQLYQSNDYMAYVQENVLTSPLRELAVTAFIILPFLLLGDHTARFVSHYKWGTVLGASMMLALGTIIKVLSRFTESAAAFDLIVLLGGACQALGLFMAAALVIKYYRIDWLVLAVVLITAELLMLLVFTGIGFGDYKVMLLDTILLRSMIIGLLTAVILIIFSYFRKSAVNT
ncbi:hypothetical protein [Macrococcus equipercicus]|uniref:Uncharacterized protein n=1 Tax=Macrococcus equipercicus TaxID=69967 RepID=A0A9Q9BMT4_9STAP|nr:hypothetical protein [Macrococcus equipercicus]UTH14433.1 hypothetical protein KFV11_03475 [Macrococcus equipercicus]